MFKLLQIKAQFTFKTKIFFNQKQLKHMTNHLNCPKFVTEITLKTSMQIVIIYPAVIPKWIPLQLRPKF